MKIVFDRVLEISLQLEDAVVNQDVGDGVVCPPILRKGLFTTSAIDNIAHNPTATTATSSFHGTSISVFQYPTSETQGKLRNLQQSETKAKKIPHLPESYINVKPAFISRKPLPPAAPNMSLHDTASINRYLQQEYSWLSGIQLLQSG